MPKQDDTLDKLFHDGELPVPPDFGDKVMRRLQWEALPQISQPPWWQWLALGGGLVLGIFQVLAFLLSVWTFNSAA